MHTDPMMALLLHDTATHQGSVAWQRRAALADRRIAVPPVPRGSGARLAPIRRVFAALSTRRAS
ncbi:hypothetical protein JQN58_30370 [Aneurinibacillus sp. BA2021]|nr:hypothetical protein [Aneurinibacillus sp. BA2021]